MGVTISNHKHSIDMGGFGYIRLREAVSRLFNCEEFTKAYAELPQAYNECYKRGFSTMEEYYEDYDKRVNNICEANSLDVDVVNWLYSPDCGYSASPKICRHLWKLIKDYDDDEIYGYAAHKNAARFKDFKQIVEECAKERRTMRIS